MPTEFEVGTQSRETAFRAPSVWLPGRSLMHHKNSPAFRWRTIATLSLGRCRDALRYRHQRIPRGSPAPVRPETVTVSPATGRCAPPCRSFRTRSSAAAASSGSSCSARPRLFALPILERLFGDPAAESGHARLPRRRRHHGPAVRVHFDDSVHARGRRQASATIAWDSGLTSAIAAPRRKPTRIPTASLK